MQRALRRHMMSVAKERAKKILMRWHGKKDLSGRVIGFRASTPVNCSCPGCRNQRRNDWLPNCQKMTMQERKHQEDLEFGFQELQERDSE